MSSYPVELLQGMLERYSPSGSEGELAGFLRSEMQANGFRARIDGAGNVVGVLGTEGWRILLCGHMDTVPGKIPVRREGDLLYGRGAVDAKSSLAAMIVGATLAKKRSGRPLQITVVGAVEEETSSRGIREVLKEENQYDLAVFGEPSGASNIVVGYKGSVKLRVALHTAGGHSASPWLHVSSYEEACSFWNAFQNKFLDNGAESRFGAVTGCVTSIMAGGPGNSVPANAMLEVDNRIPPTLTSSEFVQRIEKFIRAYAASHGAVSIDLQILDQTDAVIGSGNSQAASAFRWAIRQVLGERVAIVKKTGTSDMNLFAETQAIPMFAYGPGDSSLDHTDGEYVKIPEYLASIEVYAQALPRFAERNHESELLSPTAK